MNMSWKKVTDYWAEYRLMETDRRGVIGLNLEEDKKILYDLSHENFDAILGLLRSDMDVWYNDDDKILRACKLDPAKHEKKSVGHSSPDTLFPWEKGPTPPPWR